MMMIMHYLKAYEHNEVMTMLCLVNHLEFNRAPTEFTAPLYQQPLTSFKLLLIFLCNFFLLYIILHILTKE